MSTGIEQIRAELDRDMVPGWGQRIAALLDVAEAAQRLAIQNRTHYPTADDWVELDYALSLIPQKSDGSEL